MVKSWILIKVSVWMFVSPTCFTELYKTTSTTVRHQQHNQEMLSASITSMRFYFIVPYAAKKKNIYVSSNQTHRAIIFTWNLKECYATTVTTSFVLTFLDILSVLHVQIYANETDWMSVFPTFSVSLPYSLDSRKKNT